MAGQSARDIKRRIRSIKNTQQITKAMEMVAAAKLRRVQSQATQGRPFSEKLREVLVRLVTAARSGEGARSLEHPLLEKREVKRVLYVVVSADRGLAGGYNANLLRRAVGELSKEEREYEIIAIGRKARDFFRKRGWQLRAEHVQLGDDIDYTFAQGLAQQLMAAFTAGEFDEIKLVYTRFVSVVSQQPVVERLLPIEDPAAGAGGEEEPVEYRYEPSPEAVLGILLPRYVETEVYRALMESKASELGARMTAMRNASDNAEEMIAALTLSYNRARQAGITKEISEIVGGAEALAGAQ